MKSSTSYPLKNITVFINKPVNEVYEFASNPDNFPVWIAFITSMTRESETTWLADTELGKLKMRFVPKNTFGVIDHWVTLPDGSTVYNPMRIVANGEGSEFIFTLFRMPNTTDAAFEQDEMAVTKDLKTLKHILGRS